MFDNVFKGKNVLITGNSGFKGSWLSLWLRKLGAKVYGISMGVPSKPSMFEELAIENKIQSHFDNDISVNESLEHARNNKDLTTIFNETNPDFVFHLAAQSLVSKSYENPWTTINTNVMGTTNILHSIMGHKKRVIGVIITSDKCYDNLELDRGYHEDDLLGGKDPYSGSKGAAELIVKSFYHSFFKDHTYGSVIATARAGNVIGGGDWGKDRIVPDAVRAWSANDYISIRNPRSTRPWQHVLEPLSGYLNLAQQLLKDRSFNGQSFNFGPDESNKKTVEELIIELGKNWGFPNSTESYRIESSSNFHEAGLLQLDCSKAKEKLQWQPNLTYDEMVIFTARWYKAFYRTRDMEEMILMTTNQIDEYERSATKKRLSWTN
ncbi:MAG: CDP-glucose 4,6-dehydratase [Chloroflexota bacterium]